MPEVNDLRIRFPTGDSMVKAMDGISFTLERGRTLGIVGRRRRSCWQALRCCPGRHV